MPYLIENLDGIFSIYLEPSYFHYFFYMWALFLTQEAKLERCISTRCLPNKQLHLFTRRIMQIMFKYSVTAALASELHAYEYFVWQRKNCLVPTLITAPFRKTYPVIALFIDAFLKM